MSQTDAPDDVEFAPAHDPSGDGSTNDSIDLDPGEELAGTITDVNFDAGYNGVVWIDGRRLNLNQRMRQQLETFLVGTVVKHEKGDEEQSFEDDDGETVTYYDRDLRFPADD